MTRKITRALGRIYSDCRTSFSSGTWTPGDWDYGRDYVEGMWLMLQQPEPDDYVIATGESHSVLEFLELAFARNGLDWRQYVDIPEVDFLCGDPRRRT